MTTYLLLSPFTLLYLAGFILPASCVGDQMRGVWSKRQEKQKGIAGLGWMGYSLVE